jgi:hypothetical protein
MSKSIYKLSNEKQKEALDMGYVPMFASRDSMEEASEYFTQALESLAPHDMIAVLTAFHVLKNTEILIELEVQTDDIFGA